jgi:hypothetical protein
METTLVALLAYGAYLLVGGLALTVLMATQGGAALSPAGEEADTEGTGVRRNDSGMCSNGRRALDRHPKGAAGLL